MCDYCSGEEQGNPVMKIAVVSVGSNGKEIVLCGMGIYVTLPWGFASFGRENLLWAVEMKNEQRPIENLKKLFMVLQTKKNHRGMDEWCRTLGEKAAVEICCRDARYLFSV
eukprot:Gb_05852 [translate_table: standard]